MDNTANGAGFTAERRILCPDVAKFGDGPCAIRRVNMQKGRGNGPDYRRTTCLHR
jgi:hypothetical protein